jgi:hypothetical protein
LPGPQGNVVVVPIAVPAPEFEGPVISPFALNVLLSVRSGIAALRLAPLESSPRSWNFGATGSPLDEEPSGCCVFIVTNVGCFLPPRDRWKSEAALGDSRAGLCRSGRAQKNGKLLSH